MGLSGRGKSAPGESEAWFVDCFFNPWFGSAQPAGSPAAVIAACLQVSKSVLNRFMVVLVGTVDCRNR